MLTFSFFFSWTATEWYLQRANEIDARAGQIDAALALIDIGIANQIPGLEYVPCLFWAFSIALPTAVGLWVIFFFAF